MGFSSLETAWRALHGYEVLNSMRKGQVQGRDKGDSISQIAFIYRLYGVAA
jgi:IS6 family transposase